MGSAFNEQERKMIISKLQEAAQIQARTIGMKKTTIEELTSYANISKGAFYHFYESKELLFFEVVEKWHDVMLQTAITTIQENRDLPAEMQAKKAFFSVLEFLEEDNVLSFFENDLELLIRKLPDRLIKEHRQSDTIMIQRIIEEIGVEIKEPIEVVTGLVWTVVFAMAQKQKYGEYYTEVIKVLLESICHCVFISDVR